MLLNVVPTLILLVIIKYRHKLFKQEWDVLKQRKTWESIFYSFCISFMGYSLLTSISYYMLDPPTVHKTQTPIMIIYSVLFSPIFEELICRKFLLNKLSKYININLSILISSFAFAALHFDVTSFLGYMFLGVIWSYYYKKSNSILVPIISHFLFNYFVILIQSVKG